MITWTVILTMQVAITALVIIIGLGLHWKEHADALQMSPFECGFIPSQNSRSNFSLHFFLVTLVFLIFDVELVILFPYFWNSQFTLCWEFFAFGGVLVILTGGLLWEWAHSMLEWQLLV